MPTPETLERFIARVKQNAHAEAVEEFFHDAAQRVPRHVQPPA